jgi:hypothetical protein
MLLVWFEVDAMACCRFYGEMLLLWLASARCSCYVGQAMIFLCSDVQPSPLSYHSVLPSRTSNWASVTHSLRVFFALAMLLFAEYHCLCYVAKGVSGGKCNCHAEISNDCIFSGIMFV